MNENEIATIHVRSHLTEQLGWADELISQYGKVPVKTGPFGVKFADFVCYVLREGQKKPFAVVEVKKPGEILDSSQPEFYAFHLGPPFFAITNGKEWQWYFRGQAMGESIRLQNLPVPYYMSEDNLSATSSEFAIPDYLQENIDSYEALLNKDDANCRKNDLLQYRKGGCVDCQMEKCLGGCMLGDTIWHDTCSDKIHQLIVKVDLQNLSADDLKELFESMNAWLMSKPPNINRVMSSISIGSVDVREALRLLHDEGISVEERFDRLRGIKGFGPFMVSQFLASVDKSKYIVMERNVLEELRTLGFIHGVPLKISGEYYVHANDICNNLMRKGFKNSHHLGLALVHNYLWHSHVAKAVSEAEELPDDGGED